MSKKKSFYSTYSELYLVDPEIYNKIINSLDSTHEENRLSKLNEIKNKELDKQQNAQNVAEIQNKFENVITKNRNINEENNYEEMKEKNHDIIKDDDHEDFLTVDGKLDDLKKFIHEKYQNIDKRKSVTESCTQTNDVINNCNIKEDGENMKHFPSAKENQTATPFAAKNSNIPKTTKKSFFCEICGKGFVSKWTRKRHITTQHEGPQFSKVGKNLKSKTSLPDMEVDSSRLYGKRKRFQEDDAKTIVKKTRHEGEIDEMDVDSSKLRGKRKRLLNDNSIINSKRQKNDDDFDVW